MVLKVSVPPERRLCVVLRRVSTWKWLSGFRVSCGGKVREIRARIWGSCPTLTALSEPAGSIPPELCKCYWVSVQFLL